MDWRKLLLWGVVAAVLVTLTCSQCRRRLSGWIGGTD